MSCRYCAEHKAVMYDSEKEQDPTRHPPHHHLLHQTPTDLNDFAI